MMHVSGNRLIVDLFAGGGGASLGMEQAFAAAGHDRRVDIAINHDPRAIVLAWRAVRRAKSRWPAVTRLALWEAWFILQHGRYPTTAEYRRRSKLP